MEQLGRHTVEATVWPSEAEGLLSRSLRFSPQESALEQGWLLAKTEQRVGYSLEELARRFDRSGWRWWNYCRRRSGGKWPKAKSRRRWR